jgi:DNA-binding NarL/FixJ family response regulator
MAIRVAVVSHSRLFSEGIKRLIEDDPEITIAAVIGQSFDADGVANLRADVVLIDHQALFSIPRHILSENGFDAKLVLVESRTEPSLIDREIIELISKGTMAGILSADANGELLKKAIKVVASGELWLGHITIKNILTQAMFIKKSITRQESEIAALILRGCCNKEIARELKITEATVKSHCNRLFKKFNVSGRLQLGLKLKGLYEDKKFMPTN